jgi:O-antigen ligase
VVLVMVGSLFLVSGRGSLESALDDGWDRFVLWESSVKATPNLFGVGTGDYKAAIQEYYVSAGMTQFANETYNAHNQFIQLLFSNGMPGLLAFALLLLRPLYFSYKRENVLGILTLFPFVVYSITEVFLGRYQGVVFFSLVSQVWLTYYYHTDGFQASARQTLPEMSN